MNNACSMAAAASNIAVLKRAKILSILNQPPLEIGDQYILLPGGQKDLLNTAGVQGLFGYMQDVFKKKPQIYQLILSTVAPVVLTRRFRRLQARLFRRYDSESVIVNYGSGPFVLRGRCDVVNVDLFAFGAVDVVCDLSLPFVPESVDFVVSIAVLEHLREPEMAVSEMHRCLKPGGELLVYIPFMQPLHAAPHDYQRYTKAGLKQLFRNFQILEVGVGSGSCSGFLWVFQQWFAGMLSFGCKPVRDVLLILIMIVTFPFKYLDLIYEPFDRGGEIASAFYINCRRE